MGPNDAGQRHNVGNGDEKKAMFRKGQRGLIRAVATKMGPNDARCVVWAICKFLFPILFLQKNSNLCLYSINGAQNAYASRAPAFFVSFFFVSLSSSYFSITD